MNSQKGFFKRPMPLYEHVFIARQDISSAQVDSLTSTFSALVKEQGGKVEKTEYWGLRTLAYRIKKSRKGHYVLFNLDAPPNALQELERNERLNEDILRYMTIRVEELEETPSVLMRASANRDEPPKERGRYDRGVKPQVAPTAQAPKAGKAAPDTPELKEGVPGEKKEEKEA